MHMCYERPGLVTALNQAVGYDKWDRGGPGVAGGGGGGSAGSWAGRERERERERDRERERQARAHQMSHAHAPEPDASALFPAPVKITGNNDRVSQQIQIKLGDYNIARPLLDDPSKSIGICAEPPSPAPCLQSRRESEFKKPAHAPQNGRIHHRSFYNKNDVPGSTGAPLHRPPPLRISNGIQHQNSIDSSQPPIEHILKEMKSLPTPLSVLAQTPRKEHDNKFIFNPHTNKVEIPQQSNDLKSPPPKPGLDNRISNSISSNSPDVVSKDLGLSESDDEAAATTRLHPILSPIGSGGSPTSDSDSSHSESESESSSTESSTAPTTEPLRGAVDQAPTQRDSWSLSNFAPPSAAISDQSTYEADKQLAHALHDAKGKPSPISELSDSETSSPSPRVERRRSTKPSQSQSSDDERPARNTPSPRVPSASAHVPAKRGRPAKPHTPEERPAKKKRGRPRKVHPPSPPARSTSPPRSPDSDVEPPAPAPAPAPALPPQPPTLAVTKMNIFRKVFTPRKGDEGGGKGGKGGKGKGGKGKGQVTIIEVTAPESGADDDDRRHRDRSDERRQNEEAIAARLSPQPEERKRDRDRNPHNRLSERRSAERTERLPYERIQDRLSTERTSTSNDRLSTERTSNDRLQVPNDRISISSDRSDKSSIERRISSDRSERLSGDKSSLERRLSSDRPVERRSADRVSERYVKAEADVGSGLVKAERGSERLAEASSNGSERRSRGGGRVMVRIPLSRLRAETIRALQRAPKRPAPGKHSGTETEEQGGIVAATNHERTGSDQTPLHSCFERLPPPDQPMPLEDRDHKYYLNEAARLRTSAEREQEPLQRVMLYLESVLCFVRTGEVLEQELDTKRAFTIYRETIEYIKSIHSMPQRFRASPHSTFNKLDILSLRVQSLLYLRMFKMYNREVKEYHKIVQEYQQKPAHAESVSPLSPTPSPAGSVGSVGSGSASSGYCSLVHSVPANAHNALLQLTKYYTFLYVAHDLWEHSETLCRQRPNQDLFIAVDRKCGPLTLFSTFRHLVDYVHYAITLLKQSPRE